MKLRTIIIFTLVSPLLLWSQGFRVVPTALVNRMASFDAKRDSSSTISDFFRFLHPDSTFDEPESGVLNPILVNLDADPNLELLALVGLDEYDTELVLLKNIRDEWLLLFSTPVHVWYSPPELNIANNASPNKVFYTRQLYDRGSGIFKDGYEFFKLIDNKVYRCLTIVNEARILGWGLFLNQEVKTKFSFSSSYQDKVWVVFHYNFFPGAVFDSDQSWDSHDDLSFVRGDKGINFVWDSTSCSYKPNVHHNSQSLNEAKISCFGRFGDDSIFVRAFAAELKEKLESDTTIVKSLLEEYLYLAKTNATVSAPGGGLEQSGQHGGMKLYAPKKTRVRK